MPIEGVGFVGVQGAFLPSGHIQQYRSGCGSVACTDRYLGAEVLVSEGWGSGEGPIWRYRISAAREYFMFNIVVYGSCINSLKIWVVHGRKFSKKMAVFAETCAFSRVAP